MLVCNEYSGAGLKAYQKGRTVRAIDGFPLQVCIRYLSFSYLPCSCCLDSQSLLADAANTDLVVLPKRDFRIVLSAQTEGTFK